ncbi:mycofactocin biosynthesis peptidyl-dipeptidase MftE [soil metagenome]
MPATTVGGVADARRLGDTAWTALDGSRPLLVIPVGSCEQHGPHLPMSTDTIIAVALAERAARSIDHALVGPALTVTASGEHAGFPGTLSIGTDVMEQVVVELVRSADWANGTVLVNGHGGNRAPVDAAVRRLRDEGRRVEAWWPRVGGKGDLHAGHTETSLLLALAPHLVEVSAATPGSELDPDSLRRLVTDGVGAVSANGVLGDPTAATAEHGADLLAELVDDLVTTMTGFDTGSDGRGGVGEHP